MSVTMILLITLLTFNFSNAQTCSVATADCEDAITGDSRLIMSTPSNIDFVFDKFSQYTGGIIMAGSTELHVRVDALTAACKWSLKMTVDNNVGATVPAVTDWYKGLTYGLGTTGATPQLDLIEIKVYNGCNTPIASGTYQNFMAATGSSIDIINDIVINPAGSCATNVNGPGWYNGNHNEYNFMIDYRIVPGFNFSPGLYQLKINFCLVEN